MKLYANALATHLSKPPQGIYLIHGAEVLLVEEAVDALRHKAREVGYSERERFAVESGFDWNQLLVSSQSMSIFSSQRIIELRIPTAKPGDAGGKALVSYTANPPPDVLLVIIAGAIDKRSQNTKWFKAVEKAGVVVDCPAVPQNRLNQWIEQRLRSRQVNFNPEIVPQLAQYVEGNLLAAAQEIDLLALLFAGQTVGSEQVQSVVADHARFSAFNLADACLAGASERALRILQSLRREQMEPVIILWALSKDTRTLCELTLALQQGKNLNALMRQHGIWSSRQGLINKAMGRLNSRQWHYILKLLARLDLVVKGQAPLQQASIWQELEYVIMLMCGVRLH